MESEKRFRETIKDLMKIMYDILVDVTNDGLCDVSLASVDLCIKVIGSYNTSTMIEEFINIKDKWHLVEERNEEFVTVHMVKCFKDGNMPMNTNMITFPFDVYNKIKDDEEWQNIETDDWPIIKEDLENIWNFIEALIGISKSYLKEKKGVQE